MTPTDPRWIALAEGTSSDAERAVLEAEAAQTAEGRALWPQYRPFDAEKDERLVEGVRRRLSTLQSDPLPG